jgi:hypothetical protein
MMNISEIRLSNKSKFMSFNTSKINQSISAEVQSGDLLSKFLNETEEWNDVFISDTFGKTQFLFSRQKTLDEEYLFRHKDDLK